MNAKDLEYFENILLKKRQEVMRGEEVFNPIGAAKIDNLSEIGDSDCSTDLADLGSDTLRPEEQSYFEERSSKFLRHLDEALERIERGGYGYCCNCGEGIPKERLEAVPHTRYCVACKRQWE